MIESIVAKRYAKALLEIGREEGREQQYGEELARVVELFAASAELGAVLANPGFDFAARRQVLSSLLEKLGTIPMVANLLYLLLDRGRIGALADIYGIYQRLLDEVRGITRAEVLSASSLDESEVAELGKALRAVAGREVKLEISEDPSLLGGVVAKIGDLVLDGSVKTQLESLKESLKRGEYA